MKFDNGPGLYTKFAALSRPLEFHQRPATGALGAALLVIMTIIMIMVMPMIMNYNNK